MRSLIYSMRSGGSKVTSGLRRSSGRRSSKRRQLLIYLMIMSVGLGTGLGAWLLHENFEPRPYRYGTP